MSMEYNMRLTASEIAQLWTVYMNESLSICFLKYFLNHVEDREIQPVIEHSLELSQSHIPKITELFEGEGYPIPIGFKEGQDVDVHAPRLYSDTYMLSFIKFMSEFAMNICSQAVATAARKDAYEFFSNCLSESNKLHNMARQVLLSKGLYIRPPYLPVPEKPDFVKKQSFLADWFAEKRPLTGLEISDLYGNIQRNSLGEATMIGFMQTAKSQHVQQFLGRGKEISKKHIEIFSSVMRQNDLPAPMTWDTEVSDSKTPVFSEKIMMFLTTALISASIGYYGKGMANSFRHGLGVHYTRLSAEIAHYAEDGANIMIDNGWLEEPPKSANRSEISKE
ncbi:DUF3231 family protein [Texcoconibacillus texcoconensis]|uniref:DUF3231 family protein n=1 Tax=Texcoconibacillus texcoconensis TaxID=1095777 RepID=A0A840QRM5_9BACI|nr:DUF3231 family protein [Texcoconibacillus texcoconensis]MBB5174015.1 hypothetical protein [Texcoconibacillus texcoconensis]